MDVVILGPCRVHLVPVVRGLVSERSKVRDAALFASPDAVGVSISGEELEGLRSQGGESAELSSLEEEVYARALSEYGEVRKPPPAFVEALAVAAERDVPVHPLDMGEDAFTQAYVETVSSWDLILHAFDRNRLRRWTPRARTPEGLAVEWDRVVNRRRGYAKLEKLREGHVARRIREVARVHRALLAVVELERVPGVATMLRA